MQEVLAAGNARRASRAGSFRMWDDYKELIKSDVADIKNSGGRPAGTITAALFLKEFADDYPWVHLDIAGTAYTESPIWAPCRADRRASRSAPSSSSCEVALGERFAASPTRSSLDRPRRCCRGRFAGDCTRRSPSVATRSRADGYGADTRGYRAARAAATARPQARHDPRAAAAARGHDAEERFDAARARCRRRA